MTIRLSGFCRTSRTLPPRAIATASRTLSRIAAGHPINRISELMPWAYQSPIDEIAA